MIKCKSQSVQSQMQIGVLKTIHCLKLDGRITILLAPNAQATLGRLLSHH